MMPRPLYLIEFNELCPSLLARFIGQGELPHFRRLYESSTIYTTDAGEEPPNLEPWIQWPTVHFGVPYAEHKIFHLGDGRSYRGKGIAQILSDAVVRVGVCGSMNVNYCELNGYLIPDPWDKDGQAHPAWLQPFYRTVANQVQESSREGAGSKGDLVRFGLFMLNHGLRPSTMKAIAAQLLAERRDPGLKWRRAVLLDAIQYDLFRFLNRQFQTQFATFFCNSTAHFQHYYWRNMEPERFEVPPPETDHPSLRGAILYGYRAMDRIIGQFLRDYRDATLVLATGLSQQPWVETTKCTFRPIQFEELLAFAGVHLPASAVKPVMAEQFFIDCPGEAMASECEARLRQLSLESEPLMTVERTGQSVFGGCAITTPTDAGRLVTGHGGATRRFGDLFYMIHSMRSGRHHPDGVLWVRNGVHRVVEGHVPLTAVAPTILHHFGVTPPTSMEHPGLAPASSGGAVVSGVA
jgi:hypothetical protein